MPLGGTEDAPLGRQDAKPIQTTRSPLEARQALRMRRLYMAMASYAMWVAIGLLGWAGGQVELPLTTVGFITVGILATNLYFYFMIRSGRNLSRADPSMTLSQLLIALAWALLLIFSAHEERGVMTSVYLVLMLFGVFQLDRRQFLLVATLAAVGYVAVVGLDAFLRPYRVDFASEAFRLTVLGAVLAWCTFFGTHVASLRETLRERNDALKEAVERAHRLAERDPLTQAFNRRFIMASLNREKSRADRTGIPFSVAICDLDHFKIINDRYGHLAGDQVLMAFAELSRRELRGMDVVGAAMDHGCFGRYGGEEFICVLPGTKLGGARECGERLREATEHSPIDVDGLFKVTLSVGVSEYRRGEDIEDVLRRADNALYLAKQNGRNQVACERRLKAPPKPGDVVPLERYR